MLAHDLSWADALNLQFVAPLFISILAVLTTYWSVQLFNRSIRIGLFLDFSKRYNSLEMRDAMTALAGLYVGAPDRSSFAETWYRAFLAQDATARQLDSHRRFINRYYSDLVRLFRFKTVNRKFIRMAGQQYALNVYFKVVHPMNESMFRQDLQISEFERDYNELRRVLRPFGNGRITGE